MELFKTILNLIISFFQHKTEVAKNESKLADEKEEVVVQTIRANTNAQSIQQMEKTNEAVIEVEKKQAVIQIERRHKPLEDQVNDQFGQDD